MVYYSRGLLSKFCVGNLTTRRSEVANGQTFEKEHAFFVREKGFIPKVKDSKQDLRLLKYLLFTLSEKEACAISNIMTTSSKTFMDSLY